jgi:hypothetical protein
VLGWWVNSSYCTGIVDYIANKQTRNNQKEEKKEEEKKRPLNDFCYFGSQAC